VNDFRIYERDFWACQMPECLHPEGRAIDPATYVRRPSQGEPMDPWRASIDHIVPLAKGGWDIAANKRAAHALCNEASQAHYPKGLALDLAAGREDARAVHRLQMSCAIRDLLSPAARRALDDLAPSLSDLEGH
jgi:hypothetical protein